MNIRIRKSVEADLAIFFKNQTDEEANFMAAFTPDNPHDEQAYLTKWKRLINDETVNIFSIIVDSTLIGCVVKFVMEGDAEITYAIDKNYWGKGITTQALKEFMDIEKIRPIYGRTAFDNLGSQKILEKNGFQKIGNNHDFANARGKEIEEFIYRLDA